MGHDRVHACLDGELPREALIPEERRSLEALEGPVADAVTALRRAPVPDLTAGVMAGLPPVSARQEIHRPGAVQRFTRWLWNPVSITFRPAWGLAGIAAAAAVLLVLPLSPASSFSGGFPAPVAEADDADSRLYVQFRIEVPGASQVALAGSFTDWRPELQLTEVAPGVWSAMVPLDPGVHDYTFVVDGERMLVDPYAPRVADSFGGSNSRLFLPAPNEQA